MKATITTLLIALALSLSACGPAVQTSDREPAPPPSEAQVQTNERTEPVEPPSPSETEPQVVGGENVESYFEALATQDPRNMKELADLAADDSPAQVYAEMQYAIIVAQQESYGGGMTGPQVMRTTDDGEIELSSEPMGFEGDIEATTLFSDFQLTDGKLASFSVATPDDDDEAEPISIDERVVSGGQRQNIAGNTVRLMGAYHSVQSDSVFVVISTEATGDGMEYSWNNAYVTDDGREVAGTEALGNDQPRKGRESPYVVTFDAVDLGGTAEIGVFTADYNEATLKFDLEPSF